MILYLPLFLLSFFLLSCDEFDADNQNNSAQETVSEHVDVDDDPDPDPDPDQIVELDENDQEDTGESFVAWLHEEGVNSIFENAVGHNRKNAKSVYLFATREKALAFKNKYLNDDTKYGGVFFDKRSRMNAVPVNEIAQEHLKESYIKTNPVTDQKRIDDQKKLLEEALYKVNSFNEIGALPGQQISPRLIYIEVPDRIARVAELLRNGDEEKGWNYHAAASSIDIMLSIYIATNHHLLSPMQIDRIKRVQKMILKVNKKGRFVGGLKADANFISYIKEHYTNEKVKDIRKKLIREDVNSILNGGYRKIIDINASSWFSSIITQPQDPHGFKQKRFFPTNDGASEIDALILQAGGMAAHSSMRYLSKKKDNKMPGGYRYFYVKIDGGAGAENVDKIAWTGNGVYVTEIKPYFELESKTGNEVIKTDAVGVPIALDDKQKKSLDSHAELYRKHMFATIFALLDAERQILFYRSPEIAVPHGEGKGITEAEKIEWRFLNNTIKTLRGSFVPEQSRITPLQQTGNCSVFSAWLTLQLLVGEDLGADMLQSFKQYSGDKVRKQIETLKSKLSAFTP